MSQPFAVFDLRQPRVPMTDFSCKLPPTVIGRLQKMAELHRVAPRQMARALLVKALTDLELSRGLQWHQ